MPDICHVYAKHIVYARYIMLPGIYTYLVYGIYQVYASYTTLECVVGVIVGIDRCASRAATDLDGQGHD
jgi:hypothetical protein